MKSEIKLGGILIYKQLEKDSCCELLGLLPKYYDYKWQLLESRIMLLVVASPITVILTTLKVSLTFPENSHRKGINNHKRNIFIVHATGVFVVGKLHLTQEG
jgi:hypothetical protein